MISQLQTLRRTAERQAFGALNRILLPVVSAGVGSPLPVGPGAVVLETTGRVSGLPRRVPLLGVRVGDTVVVSTVRRRSQWVRNLESRPEGRVWLAGRARPARADRPQRRGPLQVVVLRVHDPDEPER